MRMNIARNAVLAFHKLYIPGINEKIRETLSAIAPEIIKIESKTDMPANISDIFSKNLKIDIKDTVTKEEKTK
jgi:VIT1/CCC1 family predicted Fe2+/Mn2+ transporter